MMGKGRLYTEEENEKLIAIMADHNGETYSALADRAQRYGVCAERDRRALALHMGILARQDEEDDEPQDPAIAFFEGIAQRYEELYMSLRNTILDTSRLYRGNQRNSLSLDYKAILKWFWENETTAIASRIESLELEGEELN